MLLNIGFLILVSTALWFIPAPGGMDPKAWHLFAIFVSTIIGLITKPLPMGAMALLGLTAAVVTGTMDLAKDALYGFSQPVIWLIVMVCFVARACVKARLGERLGYWFIALLGRHTLGLGYGLLITELFAAPLIPSNTARAGGIVYPILKAIAENFDSHPDDPVSARRIGSYLCTVAYQGNLITSAMFLTGMATNPMIQSMALKQGIVFSWGTWALAALLPGLASLILVPLVLYWLYPPTLKHLPQAEAIARRKLEEMGSMSRNEWLMAGVFVMMITLWIFGDAVNINPTTTALLGVMAVLILKVIKWEELLKESEAWHMLIWMAVLVGMATALDKFGFIGWFSNSIGALINGYTGVTALIILVCVYFYSHYFFAGNTSHVMAMYAALLTVAVSAGAPPLLSALLLGFFSNLFSCTTHYGSGSAAIFFGAGYVPIKTWWYLGLVVSLMHMVIWLGGGMVWWKILGIY